MNFNNILVSKPWGEEYLLYENEDIALWHLKIKQGKQTSLHAHPNKKTGLIVVAGGIKTSFLTDSFKLFPSDKIMIRQGVFHSSQAVVGDCEILEIETPNNKTDIVRLEDAYGREGTPYEGKSHYTTYKNPHSMLFNQQYKEYTDTYLLGDCRIDILDINKHNICNYYYKTYIVLSGTIKRDDFVVCGPGDVLYFDSLKLMLEKFTTKNYLKILGIKHNV